MCLKMLGFASRLLFGNIQLPLENVGEFCLHSAPFQAKEPERIRGNRHSTAQVESAGLPEGSPVTISQTGFRALVWPNHIEIEHARSPDRFQHHYWLTWRARNDCQNYPFAGVFRQLSHGIMLHLTMLTWCPRHAFAVGFFIQAR